MRFNVGVVFSRHYSCIVGHGFRIRVVTNQVCLLKRFIMYFIGKKSKNKQEI
jgi:hypothetical protein